MAARCTKACAPCRSGTASWPARGSRSTSALPMKPDAPVTQTRISSPHRQSNQVFAGVGVDDQALQLGELDQAAGKSRGARRRATDIAAARPADRAAGEIDAGGVAR